MTFAHCRFCGSPLEHTFVDLGLSPLSNSYLRAEQLNQMEPFYPLHARVCSSCFLVQVEEFERPQNIFGNYSYFSSYSSTWLQHASDFAAMAVERFRLNGSSRVIEIASNDGYLLQYFRKRGISVLGIEPAENVAVAAREKGIETLTKFFGVATAQHLTESGVQGDLVIGNNVLAHVPDLNDFVAGLKRVLKAGGTISLEFPHLLRLIQENQFDTIYHEHFSYFSLSTAEKILAHHGLQVYDVEELPTHGGSLRAYAAHIEDGKTTSARVSELREREMKAGVGSIGTYTCFSEQVRETKRALLEFLIGAKRQRKKIVGYGAPAKGNTLLNYCGIGRDFLDFTADISPHKQSHFLPGTHIPIFHPDMIRQARPDFVLILPWNLREEITQQLAYIREWGGRFVVPIPRVEVIG
jgi:2-polyprenyl-3-methyl-5-hydroxy-6-metoxy-1,4-benzoquinol methylase